MDINPKMEAMARTTHMAISCPSRSILKIMAYDGISRCFAKDDKWFMAVVVTDGAGSYSRKGLYKNYTDQQMKEIRKLEQKKAAFVGEYGALALLDYTSADAKSPCNHDIVDDLKELINNAKPEIIYTHNLADSHDTHIGVSN
jgi:LmbE family N-acetylglucosaminyl deacetylase